VESYDFTFGGDHVPSFETAPSSAHRRAFGLDYLLLTGRQGGELYLTRAGWARAGSLRPREW